MQEERPEPLWREVVGDTEPWRRGRIFLVALAAWSVLTQGITVAGLILLGRIELVLVAAIALTVFWLLFYFIWIGVHWVRWLSGGLMALVAFANLIWGIRDGNVFRLIDGTISFPIAAYLALAPSVYFFALRQKETVRWKEALVVAAVFGLLLASFGAASLALFGYKAEVETRGREFADRAFRRIFAEGDTAFLRTHKTARLMREEGWDRLSWFMVDRGMRLGLTRDIRPAEGRLQFWFRFPATVGTEGRMSTLAETDYGPVRLQMIVGEAGGNWQIDGIWWQFVDPAAVPR